MLGHNGLALGGGDLVGHIGTGHLGDGVAVLNLDGDGLHLGVVNAVLGGDLTAGVLDGGLQRVSDSVGSNWGGGISGVVVGSSEELGVSLGISLPLGDVVSGSVTDHINDLLADLLVLDLLSLDSLGGADVLGGGGAGLGDQGLHHGLAVGGVVGHGSHGSHGRSAEEVLRISLSISSWGSPTGGNKTGDSKYLHHFEIVRYFPRWQVE